MSILRRLLRAEYWWQPGQLPRRAWRIARGVTTRDRVVVRLPWGFPIAVDPRESIGRSIVALNTLDLPVTEAIWRLLDHGDRCADVGANIGYMTSVMAARLQRSGTIIAFEPVPELADALRANVDAWSRLSAAQIDVRQLAVADRAGAAAIHIPATFSENRGQASLAPADNSPIQGRPASNTSFAVETVRLDEIFDDTASMDLIKIDVEGCELQVLRGAEKFLHAGRIRDIVMEEYGGAEAESLHLLRGHGYEIFRVTREWTGPGLRPADCTPRRELDPPTYLATKDARRARARFATRGWLSLSRPRASWPRTRR